MKLTQSLQYNSLTLTTNTSFLPFIYSSSGIVTPLYSFNKIFLKTYDDEDIVTALKLTQNNIKKEDVIYISDGNSILYEYYKRYFNFSNPVITDEVRFTSEEEYINHLNSLPKGVTYYWIFAHHPNKMTRLQSVYKWARNKQNFRIYHDNKSNALIIFTM